MITLSQARTLTHRLRLLALLYEREGNAHQPPFDLFEAQFETFGRSFLTKGELYGIYMHEQPLGFCWVRQRGLSLHLLGLQIRPACRGCGVGKRALRLIEQQAPPETRILQLDVHRSNRRAYNLYHRLGFTPARFNPYSGLYVLRKHRHLNMSQLFTLRSKRQVANTRSQPEGIRLVRVAHGSHRQHQPDFPTRV